MSTGSQATLLAGYGLAGKSGPWSSTPRDKQILNSRAGGEHAGHGNWWQSFNPKPYIQTKPSSKQYRYIDGPDIYVKGKFEVGPEAKIPGISRSTKTGISGIRPPPLKRTAPYGVGNSVDASTSTEPMKIVSPTNTNDLSTSPMYPPISPTDKSPVHVGPTLSPSSANSLERNLRYDPPDPDVNMVGSVRGKRQQRPPLTIKTRGLKAFNSNKNGLGTKSQIDGLNVHIDAANIHVDRSPLSDVSESSKRPKKIVALMK